MSSSPGAPPNRRRFSRGQRAILALLAVLVVASGILLGVIATADSRVERVGSLPSLASGSEVYLIVGSDSREDVPPDLEGKFGSFPGARTDVIMLAQVVDGTRQILSLPRDLKVEVPGHGTQRINAAFELGGPDLLIETVARETGIRPGRYVEVDFAGFAEIIDALGGIELTFPHPARDAKTGLNVEAGTIRVDGATALAYSRSRHYEEFRDGSWVAETGGDLPRTGRQRQVLLELIETASSPAQLIRAPWVILDVSSALGVDSESSLIDVIRSGWAMRAASETDSMALPVRDSQEGDVSYVVREEPLATQVLEAFAQGQNLPDL